MKPTTIVLFGCALFGACAVAQTALQQSALMAVIAGSVIAELGGGKIGVSWSNPAAPPPTARSNVHDAAFAFALGAITAGLALAIGFATGGVQHETHGRPLLIPVAVGLIESLFFAIQTEILHRGILRVLCKRTEPRAFVPLAVLLGVAAAAGRAGLDVGALTAAASFSLALALVWNRAGGGLAPIFVHTGLRFVLVVLASGSGFGLVGRGRIGGSPLEFGLAAAAATLVLALAVAFWPRGAIKE